MSTFEVSCAEALRSAPGNARPADSEDDRPRTAARLAIAKRIQTRSGDILAVGQGSLYPALHRLEKQGWVRAEWKESDLGREAKFYALTRDGRKQLERELKTWERLSSAVRLLIETT